MKKFFVCIFISAILISARTQEVRAQQQVIQPITCNHVVLQPATPDESWTQHINNNLINSGVTQAGDYKVTFVGNFFHLPNPPGNFITFSNTDQFSIDNSGQGPDQTIGPAGGNPVFRNGGNTGSDDVIYSTTIHISAQDNGTKKISLLANSLNGSHLNSAMGICDSGNFTVHVANPTCGSGFVVTNGLIYFDYSTTSGFPDGFYGKVLLDGNILTAAADDRGGISYAILAENKQGVTPSGKIELDFAQVFPPDTTVINALQPVPPLSSGDHTLCIAYSSGQCLPDPSCNAKFTTAQPPAATFNLCDEINKNDTAKSSCLKCMNGETLQGKSGVWTAVGCIPIDSEGIITSLLRVGLGIAGGIILLSILVASFMLTTSAGDPKKVEEAQQMISGAVIGLLFIIFSVIILQFIGVSILHIPGFGA